ncbi:hypothetical protein [Burkholderia multivorans]|uniref:hypothetical protein n=1 Tax=Burkholderia multivorans TaxID=87883 RepID=UPI0009B62ED5|nr:hypothetical protein [Burkholderia multivorans]
MPIILRRCLSLTSKRLKERLGQGENQRVNSNTEAKQIGEYASQHVSELSRGIWELAKETLINGPTSEVAGEMASNFLDDEANRRSIQ